MKVKPLISIFVAIAMIFFKASMVIAKSDRAIIGNIKNLDDSGAGCWYWRAGKPGKSKTILSTWNSSEGGAVINLNGKDTTLKTVQPWKVYILDNIKVQIKTKPYTSSDGNLTGKGIISITNGTKSQIINVEEYCGA
jgi:hypothetical protein